MITHTCDNCRKEFCHHDKSMEHQVHCQGNSLKRKRDEDDRNPAPKEMQLMFKFEKANQIIKPKKKMITLGAQAENNPVTSLIQKEGSGWVLDEIFHLDLSIAQYSPLKGSSYIALHRKLM